MLKNYLIVALRNFRRNRVFSLINMLGLTIGISASLVIFMIVKQAYSFDRFEKNQDRIFRIVSDYAFQGEPGHTRGVPAPLADAAKQDLRGIDNLVSFRYYNPDKLSAQTHSSSKPLLQKNPKHIIFADEHYFSMLPYHWIAGNKESAFRNAGQVVLSESRARQYFPSTSFAEMIGGKIVYDDSITAQVSGIVADLDQQGPTDFNFQEFISLNTILHNTALQNQMHWKEWGSTTSDQQLYVQLGKNTSVASVEKTLKSIFEKVKGEDAKKNNYTWAYRLQPLNDIHFNKNYGNFDSPIANRTTLFGLILTASFLIVIAAINFINLTTANATQRAKEIGVRKTMGCSRKQLVFQFLGETFLITASATLVSILLAPLIGKLFSSFIPEGVSFSVGNSFAIIFISSLLIIVTLLAGLYPAWHLSSSNALQVLKNQAYAGSSQTRSSWLRKGLTVSQFVIAQFFVIGVLMVSKQIHFMLAKDLGFSKQAIVSIDYPVSDHSTDHKKYVLSEMSRIPGLKKAVLSNDLPSSYGWWTSTIEYSEGKKPVQSTVVEVKSVSPGYLDMLKIPLTAGRDLLPSDTISEVLINETYLHTLGFAHPSDAIQKMVKWDDKQLPIVGVFRDFHAHPLNYKIAPMVIVRQVEQTRLMLMSLSDEHERWPATIANMKKTFTAAYPGEEFKYEFLDENIANAYGDLKNTSTLLRWATGLTIFISCLGLLGLVIYTTTHRSKEIGIRKVLGATVAQIVALLSGSFIKLVALAFLIATPLALWAIHSWLNDFVFRTPVSWWIFAASGIGMILIALMTLCIQVVRTALANPVKSLKTE